MYISMTGFGSASAECPLGTISLDLSSVNHRYQEITARLPKELASFEPWLHRRLRGMFRRGKVSARIEITRASSAAAAATVDREALIRYYREISSVRDELGTERDVSLDALIALPGVIETAERLAISDDECEAMLEDLVCRAHEAWNAMRVEEGRHLHEEIERHITRLEELAADISGRWQAAFDTAFAAMRERVARALEGMDAPAPSEDRIAQEAVILADRWDIAEELARLASHIKKFRDTGESDEPVGRKLDFLVQEMNREINTINSKSADADIRWISVEAKTEVERVREQIQNLE